MAFFDKLSEIAKTVGDKTAVIAKNVGDKTGELIEIGKLNSRIASANGSIKELKTRLGQHYWEIYSNGGSLDEDAAVLCGTIKEYYEEIESLRTQLELLKSSSGQQVVCHACGALNPADALFCKSCGVKLENVPSEPDEKTESAFSGMDSDEDDPTEACIFYDEEDSPEESAEDPSEAEGAADASLQGSGDSETEATVCPNRGFENTADCTFCERCGSKL